MGMQSRIEGYQRQEKQREDQRQQEVQEEQAKRARVFDSAIRMLDVEKQLVAIRDEIWKAGVITHSYDYKLEITLSAQWDKYDSAHCENEAWYGNRVTYDEARISIVARELYVSGRYHPETATWDREDPGWDRKRVEVYFSDDCSRGRPVHSFVIDTSKPLDPATKRQFDERLIQKCIGLKAFYLYPIPKTILADRQEIVRRLLSGELGISDLPEGFELQQGVWDRILSNWKEREAKRVARNTPVKTSGCLLGLFGI